MVAFIDQERATYGVEPICAVLPIAPATYFRHHRQQRIPATRSPRAQRDAGLRAAIQQVWGANHRVYGPRKVWRQLQREGWRVARCTVERLMRALGLRGASRGRAWTVTTRPADPAARPADLVERRFTATRPNQLWVADFTYVATWGGFVYVAFVVDVFARRIVGWRVSSTLATAFVLDALEQAIYNRCGTDTAGLIHHSDRGTQYVSMRYTERLGEAGIAPSVGSRGDSSTRWPNRSSASSRRRSFAGRARGTIWRRSSTRPSPGSIGSTRDGCSSPLDTCRPPSTKRTTMHRPTWPESH